MSKERGAQVAHEHAVLKAFVAQLRAAAPFTRLRGTRNGES